MGSWGGGGWGIFNGNFARKEKTRGRDNVGDTAVTLAAGFRIWFLCSSLNFKLSVRLRYQAQATRTFGLPRYLTESCPAHFRAVISDSGIARDPYGDDILLPGESVSFVVISDVG